MGALSLHVRTSGIWQLNSVVLARDGQCLVVDPAYLPREIDEVAALARGLGECAVVFTHGHWDHVAGWRAFPGAPVLAAPALVEAVAAGAEAARRNLAEATDFDGRWYVARAAPHAWPPLTPWRDGERRPLGGAAVEALLLPGHSPDGLALLVPDASLLVAGDHLSPCEIPFVDDLDAYRRTLVRLLALLPRVEQVVPGHGRVLAGAEALEIARADLAYLEALADCAARGDAEGALALAWPRAAGVPGMDEHHRENCRKAGLAV